MTYYQFEYYHKNKELILEKLRQKRLADPEGHREKRKLYMREYKARNREKNRANDRKWYAQRRARGCRKKNVNAAVRKAKWLKATPGWTDLFEIHCIYRMCPEGYQVDHIVPLINETVCGLHVPWNLQYLTVSENASKGNRLNWQRAMPL
jgi:5-methylcytosine-specific restriction endonuclease McrA